MRSPKHQESDCSSAAEFDLVGSAGISGHKAVPTEIPLYPPDEDGSTPTHESFGNMLGMGSNVLNFGIPADLPRLNGQEDLFLQANDFGRAIDDWLNLDLNPSM